MQKSKLFEYRIIQTNNKSSVSHNRTITEAPLGDFFKGVAKGFTDVFKSKLGIKTDEELAEEAEQIYNTWFTKMKFKEMPNTIGDEGVLKVYLLPLGLGESKDGIKFVIRKSDEQIKDIENKQKIISDENASDEEKQEALSYLEGLDSGDIKYKTIIQITLFDKQIDTNTLSKFVNIDLTQLQNLAIKNNGTIDDSKNEISESIINDIIKINTILKKYNMNLFNADWSRQDLQKFQQSFQKTHFDNNDYNLMAKSVARGLNKERLTLQELQKIGNYNSLDDMYNDMLNSSKDSKFQTLLMAFRKGEVNSEEEIDQMIRDGKAPKDYFIKMITIAVGNFFNNQFILNQTNENE